MGITEAIDYMEYREANGKYVPAQWRRFSDQDLIETATDIQAIATPAAPSANEVLWGTAARKLARELPTLRNPAAGIAAYIQRNDLCALAEVIRCQATARYTS